MKHTDKLSSNENYMNNSTISFQCIRPEYTWSF